MVTMSDEKKETTPKSEPKPEPRPDPRPEKEPTIPQYEKKGGVEPGKLTQSKSGTKPN
jgi:hypothetical protein